MAYNSNNELGEVQELGVSAARMGTIYLMGEIATSVVVLVLLIFLARYLQPSSYGLYTIAVAFAGVLGIAQTFGIGTAYRKMLPEIRNGNKLRISKILTSGYVIALPAALAIAIIGVLISGLIAASVYHNPGLTLALQIAAVSELFVVLFNLTQGVLVGLGKVVEATIANTIYSVMYLVGSVLFVLMGYGVAGAVAGMLIGLVFGSAVGFIYMLKQIGFGIASPDKKDIKSIGSFSAPIMASYVAMQGALNLAVLVLGVVAIASVVGNYGAAYKLARFVDLTITATTFILIGTFSSALSRKKTAEKIGTIYNKSIYYTTIFLLPIVAYGVACATPLIKLLFSSSYATAPLYFSVMIVGMALGIIGSYAGTLIIGSGDTKKFMKYQLGATAMQIILLVLLAPLFKVAGVLIALFVITPIVLDILYMKALEKQFKFKHKFGEIIRVALASAIVGIVMFGIAMLMHQRILSLVVDGIVALLLFPPLLVYIKGVSKENLEFIRKTGARLSQLHYIVDAIVRYAYLFF
ncbi:MAG TPA: oligosaccharide flippase family protein [Candidatus Acidoferrum sp.]|nr:oligosaccharide flippase family protein [Candidatus Acidoferrum sp.]